MHLSPLRYPGGKRRLTETVMHLLDENDLYDIEYAEPYAGGASIGLALLLSEYAAHIHLNDLSRAIYAFWHTALNEPDWLCSRVQNVRVTPRVWRQQRRVLDNAEDVDLCELGFATLFLNRTNRSGILRGGMIGGVEQQGDWSLDARFNRDTLIDRIRRVSRYRSRIDLHQLDALDFMKRVIAKLGTRAFAFIDPPYILGAQRLYMNTLTSDEHLRIEKCVSHLKIPWVVTYDRAAMDAGLYEDHRRVVYDMYYAAQDRYYGREVMFVSNDLQLPSLRSLMGRRMHLVRHQSRLKMA